MNPLHDLKAIRTATASGSCPARLRAQAEEVNLKESSAGKPFYELKLRDGSGGLVLRAWNDTPAYEACRKLTAGEAVEVEGEFFLNGPFGLDAKRWKIRSLTTEEATALYAGGGDKPAASQKDLADIRAVVGTLRDPRLAALCTAFLDECGTRFARAAAARVNHHATRGGLAAHTAQMLRTADAISSVYTFLNRDLLMAGVLFHDCGKLWETCPPEQGFTVTRDLRGELLGHISIGIEVANSLWKNLPLEQWKNLTPPSEEVRLHLLHLIASHHGEIEFGSPVQPKTPEALALHALDNLDAKLEMITEALASSPEIAPGIHERLRPLGIHPIHPLPSHP